MSSEIGSTAYIRYFRTHLESANWHDPRERARDGLMHVSLKLCRYKDETPQATACENIKEILGRSLGRSSPS
jgi:hypothetical protein